MIPKDPVILLSYINTQLRDNYSSLEELCLSLGLNKEDIVSKLNKINYFYVEEQNQFK